MRGKKTALRKLHLLYSGHHNNILTLCSMRLPFTRLLKRVKERVGIVILNNVGSKHKAIDIKRIIITEKEKGYGRTLLKVTKHLAFKKLNGHRLWLDVLEFNLRAKQLFESEGFKVEGTWRECWLPNEKYHSLIFLSILEQHYKAN